MNIMYTRMHGLTLFCFEYQLIVFYAQCTDVLYTVYLH